MLNSVNIKDYSELEGDTLGLQVIFCEEESKFKNGKLEI
jgi:hypothetical protein